MKYSSKEIGKELRSQLEKGYNIARISNWAYELYSNQLKDLSLGMQETLEYLFRMQDDPQFEYSEPELKLLAERLILGDEDAIKKINQEKK